MSLNEKVSKMTNGKYRRYEAEAGTPYPMPQSSQQLGRNNMAGGNNQGPRSGMRMPIDRPYYPPGTSRNPEDQFQPALEGPEYSDALKQMQESAQFSDVISGDNNKNFGTIGLPYTYKPDNVVNGFIELAPNASVDLTVPISNDADFIIYNIHGYAFRDVIFFISESGSDRSIFNRPMDAFELLGTAQRPFALPVPYLVKGKSSLQLRITDLGNLSPSPYTGLPIADANLLPSFGNPQVLVNRVSIAFVGVKRVQRQ